MKISNYKDLEIWKEGILITKKVYFLSKETKISKEFALRDHLLKTSISISSNIAEGFERNSSKDFRRFLKIAKGSTAELLTQITICYELNLIENTSYIELEESLNKLASKIGSLSNYLNKV